MRNDVPQLMQAMDCFVLPSRFEGLPVVGIEAQAAGLPCYFADTITSEVGLTELTHFCLCSILQINGLNAFYNRLLVRANRQMKK